MHTQTRTPARPRTHTYMYIYVDTLNAFSQIFLSYDQKELLQAVEDTKLLTGESYVLKVSLNERVINLQMKIYNGSAV